MFGNNFDIDMYNHEILETLQGNMEVIYAKDNGLKKLLKVSSANKILALKPGCQVIVTRNLDSGLVNGLTAKVMNIKSNEIDVQVEEDQYLQHGMEGNTYTLEKFTFNVCGMNGHIIASRTQFPIKLGYATTVDKAQGRTISSLVVDAYNFWKPAQLGVAVGRATTKDSLQVQNFNMMSAELKHPTVVSEFNQKHGKTILGDRSCCTTKFTVPNVGVQQFNFAVFTQPNNNLTAQNEGIDLDCEDATSTNACPFDIDAFVQEQLFPECTQIQKDRNAMLLNVSKQENFWNFVTDIYNLFLDLLEKFRVPLKKTQV